MKSALEIAMESWVGRVIAERYALERVIGAGGCGAVFKARHVLTGRTLALKIIPCLELDDASAQRFQLEASAPATINHPSLVDVYDAGYDAQGPCLYVAQELLRGRDLRSELEIRDRLPWKEAVTLMVPAMAAIAAAHKAGILQRDIKPENLFLAVDRGVTTTKVLDWGIALTQQAHTRITTEGGLLGTPWYLAPELVAGSHNASVQSDCWAVACVLYECIYGNTPFDGESTAAVLSSVLAQPVIALDALVPDVPPQVARVIAKGLERDRAFRWLSMAAFLGALLDAAGLDASVLTPARDQSVGFDDIATAVASHRETVEGVTSQIRPIAPRTVAPRTWILAVGTAGLATAALLAAAFSVPDREPVSHAAVAPVSVAAVETPAPPVAVHVEPPAPVVAPVPAIHALAARRPAFSRSKVLVMHPSSVAPTTLDAPIRNGAPVFEP